MANFFQNTLDFFKRNNPFKKKKETGNYTPVPQSSSRSFSYTPVSQSKPRTLLPPTVFRTSRSQSTPLVMSGPQSKASPSDRNLNRTPPPAPKKEATPLEKLSTNLDNITQGTVGRQRERISNTEDTRQRQLDSAKRISGESEVAYKKRLAAIDQGIGKAQQATRGKIGRIEEGGELTRDKTQREYEQEQRVLAETKRRQDQALAQKFAAQGAVDSYGSQGYSGYQSEADADFTRQQATFAADKQDALRQIDLKIEDDIASAESALDGVLSEYNNLKLEVETLLATNPVEAEQAMAEINAWADNQIDTIMDNIDKTMSESAQVRFEIERSANAPEEGITQGYLDSITAGAPRPSTEADREDYLKRLGEGDGKAEGAKQEALSAIDDLLERDLSPIAGMVQFAPRGTQNAGTKALYENMIANLSLASAELLKGGGSISDAERALLRDAAAGRVSSNLSEKDMREALVGLQAKLSGGQASEQSTSDPVAILRDIGATDEEIQAYFGEL